VKAITKRNSTPHETIPSVPRGFLWRRLRGRHGNFADADGVLYWSYETFGGKDRGGARTTLCLETSSVAEAVAEVKYLCRMIAWPPPGCAANDEAAELYAHSIKGAAAWHYRNKYLRSLVRLGVEADAELSARVRVSSSTARAPGKAGTLSRSSRARSR
jgi:hypothetical protein